MSEKTVKQCTMDVVQKVMRQKEITAMMDVMYLLPELTDCVELDQEYLKARVSNLLNKKTANPINALLGLLGLRIVNINRTIEGCVEDDEGLIEVGAVGEYGGGNMLTVDPQRMAALVERIAQILKHAEEEKYEQVASSNEQISQLIQKLNAMEKQYNQLLIDHEGMRRDVLTAAQSMLSQAGPQGDTAAAKQAKELLEDLDARACWSAEGAGYSEQAMFNIYVYDDPQALPAKPCILGRDGILLKGVKYIAKEEA